MDVPRAVDSVAHAAGHSVTITDGCLLRNDWLCWDYVTTRSDELRDAVAEHLVLTLVSVGIGFLVAFPLALLARRWRRTEGLVLGVATGLYTIPSLAMFALLLPFTGLSLTTVVIGLVLYTLTILVRNILAGLDAVPAEVRESATGMGYGAVRMLWQVDLPLALPAIFAGLRIAMVSTVALATVGAIVGYGGLGDLIYSGLRSFFKAQVLTASVLCVVLAVAADLLLVVTQRLLTPWTRAVR